MRLHGYGTIRLMSDEKMPARAMRRRWRHMMPRARLLRRGHAKISLQEPRMGGEAAYVAATRGVAYGILQATRAKISLRRHITWLRVTYKRHGNNARDVRDIVARRRRRAARSGDMRAERCIIGSDICQEHGEQRAAHCAVAEQRGGYVEQRRLRVRARC